MHGLGFTRTDLLESTPFDSVDSTTYINGAKYFIPYIFDGKQPVARAGDTRLKQRLLQCCNSYERKLFNLKAWYEYAKYAERNLGWKPNEQW